MGHSKKGNKVHMLDNGLVTKLYFPSRRIVLRKIIRKIQTIMFTSD